MGKILEVTGLTKEFVPERLFGGQSTPVRAVDNADFSLETGKVLALVGESGSGKTTIARCVAGLETPGSGAVLVNGEPPDYEKPETRRFVQYVFQDTFNSLNPRMRAGDALAEPLSLHFKTSGENLRQDVVNLLSQVGLREDVCHKFPHQLSGGQRQRVVIARALALKPGLLLLDEPVSSLDVSVQAQILKLLRELNLSQGISMVFITHDLRIVRALADDIIVLKNGKIVEQGSTDAVYSSPAAAYTKNLLSSIPNSPFRF